MAIPAATVELAGDPLLALAVLALAGLVTGLVNAMAGGGTFLTVAVLIALGLPPGTANGTTRLGVLVQTFVSAATFQRRGVAAPAATLPLLAPMLLGTLGGAFAATRLDDALLRPIFGAVFLGFALLLVVRPGRFLASLVPARPVGPAAVVLALGVGAYGGFLQAGVGIPLLALLVLHLGHDPVRANAVKAWLVGLATVAALAVFAGAGQVAWAEAAVLAVGSSIGGWIGARWQIRSGARVVRWFVLIAVAASGALLLAGEL